MMHLKDIEQIQRGDGVTITTEHGVSTGTISRITRYKRYDKFIIQMDGAASIYKGEEIVCNTHFSSENIISIQPTDAIEEEDAAPVQYARGLQEVKLVKELFIDEWVMLQYGMLVTDMEQAEQIPAFDLYSKQEVDDFMYNLHDRCGDAADGKTPLTVLDIEYLRTEEHGVVRVQNIRTNGVVEAKTEEGKVITIQNGRDEYWPEIRLVGAVEEEEVAGTTDAEVAEMADGLEMARRIYSHPVQCECGAVRWVKPQDAFQVTRCLDCQSKHRKAMAAANRKAKRDAQKVTPGK